MLLVTRLLRKHTADPKNEVAVTAFVDKERNSLSMLGKMTKFGWYKGTPEDAGFYYYFYREDLSARIKNEDGSFTSQGSAAMLCFSGMPVQVYDFDGEAVTVGNLMFYTPGKQLDHYRPKKDMILDPAWISPHYYSEVMLQLYSIFGDEQT